MVCLNLFCWKEQFSLAGSMAQCDKKVAVCFNVLWQRMENAMKVCSEASMRLDVWQIAPGLNLYPKPQSLNPDP